MATKPRKKARRLLCIEWIDSHSRYGWRNDDEIEAGPLFCMSVGWVVAESKDHITLAQTVTVDDATSTEHMTIPKVCIKRKKRLK